MDLTFRKENDILNEFLTPKIRGYREIKAGLI